MDEKVAKIEGNLEQMGKRLNHVETEIGELRKDMNNRFGRIEDRFGRIENDMKINFRWTIGIMITMWVTIIIAIIFGI
jgi:tetrahydromethanopterin S-methyltransferase subunit G